jgi:hypothetical protein
LCQGSWKALGEVFTNVVLLAELLTQGRAHDSTSDAGRGIVMSLARLSPGGVESWISSQYGDVDMPLKLELRIFR